MKEIWEQALLPYNLPLTILLGLVFLFWIFSLIGLGDADAEVEVDGSIGAEADGDVDADGVFGFLMRLVNAQDVPVMLVLSLLTLFMWAVAISSNYYFNPGQSSGLAFVFLFGNFILSVFMVKLATQPLRPFFHSIKNDKEHQEPLIGSSGVVKSRVLDRDFGQCEVVRPKGAPALLNCRLAEEEKPLVRGDQILIIGFDDVNQKFIAKTDKLNEK